MLSLGLRLRVHIVTLELNKYGCSKESVGILFDEDRGT